MGANLKEVRERIKSVINTQQITKAMKMVSAAKLRKAQTAVQQLRPYANKLNAMLRNILSNLEGDASSIYGQERPVERACMVVVTSNRGLCGAFNSNICKAAALAIETKYAGVRAKGNLEILCIGKRGAEYFKKRYTDCKVITDHVMLFEDLSFDNVQKVSSKLMEAFASKQYDAIDIAYGRFRNAAVQYAEVEQWLPVEKLDTEGAGGKRADYIFEPTKENLLEYLVPSILKTQFQKCLLDTNASEHGARMTAMDKASENANEILRDLRINYNKARQEAITKEILEIVGGAAALSAD
ncbi:MAG TPA: ATP synthase F1 subunit gamma [Haliscomenobacter sp.]|uniref:ATP synthase F1 subunit gamma n=1 Tax=Haliscomenobacter sp. TaxID=2717303 RepID=UPI002C89CA7C|nr:ATP synthase F1 subunit gamma [Haliscomenobacter sp.]HOY20307.1 ATP synthase F1 subunit gamma [Haliscomenobacter sp.]HPH18167.1 ATP synthase F1 subunit gamma [Haliscomenobacter sp.]